MSVLEGIRIVELAHERVSWAGKLLGDMGADVILIEPEEGTASRATHLFLTANQAKIEVFTFGITIRASVRFS